MHYLNFASTLKCAISGKISCRSDSSHSPFIAVLPRAIPITPDKTESVSLVFRKFRHGLFRLALTKER